MEWILALEHLSMKNLNLPAFPKKLLRGARLLLGLFHVVLLEFAVQRGLPDSQHARC
jgi:hypothetical protein